MHNKRFKPSEAHKLEDPERLKWLPPSEVLAHLALKPDMHVADIGAGTGYFAIPIAGTIVPHGTVFAVDAEPEMIQKLRQKLADPKSPKNIELFAGEATQTTLKDRSVDRVLMANLWHELDDHAAALCEAARLLRPDGRLVILDWRPDVDRPPGPPIEHRISAGQVVSFLASQGWAIEGSSHIGQYSFLVKALAPRVS